MGFVIPGIDNWAHIGGFAGGYIGSRFLNPLLPEQGNHVLAAVLLLAISALAVVLSLLTGLPLIR
jgi:rhomboid protease GluP